MVRQFKDILKGILNVEFKPRHWLGGLGLMVIHLFLTPSEVWEIIEEGYGYPLILYFLFLFTFFAGLMWLALVLGVVVITGIVYPPLSQYFKIYFFLCGILFFLLLGLYIALFFAVIAHAIGVMIS